MRARPSFLHDQSGAVAATYALALIPLLAIAGLGFDYARLAGMDSELQNAADQSALAAATQLTGDTGACARAGNAAIDLVTNQGLIDSEDDVNIEIGGGTTIDPTTANACASFTGITFYSEYKSAVSNTLASGDDDARYVAVDVAGRQLNYSLVAIVGAENADGLARAVAGLGSAICNVPPVMLCNPNEPSDPTFDVDAYAGRGLRLVANDGGSNYAPGNFGYLETNAGSGAIDTARQLGNPALEGDCVAADGVTTKPGQQISVLDALNVRFDVYANGLNNVCGADNSRCPPSANSRKDLLKKNGANCAIGNQGWQEGPDTAKLYLPTSPTADHPDPSNLYPMGYPRDKCHAVSQDGSCVGGRLGDGNWDRNAYYVSNSHIWGSASKPSTWPSYGYTELLNRTEPTRYQLYRYEYENGMMGGVSIGNFTAAGAPICEPPGIPPAATPDRRVLSIAVINCNAEGVQGKSVGVDVIDWVDVFLIEPSASRTRTSRSDVYVEVIGRTTLGGGGQKGQQVRKDTPYLLE